jgi:hypothetical protein
MHKIGDFAYLLFLGLVQVKYFLILTVCLLTVSMTPHEIRERINTKILAIEAESIGRTSMCLSSPREEERHMLGFPLMPFQYFAQIFEAFRCLV